jgi:UDP-glucose 4-epimerase
MLLVTGAAGFIGAYLLDRLAQTGCRDVIPLDKSWTGRVFSEGLGFQYRGYDITCEKDLAELDRADTVVHLACLQPATFSSERNSPVDYVLANTLGTINLLEYCRRVGARKFIYTVSHREMENWWSATTLITEDMPKSFKHTGEYAPYVLSQVAATEYIDYYCKEYGIQGIILRLPPVYGYGPHTEIFKNGKNIKTGFRTFMDNARDKRPIEVWGNPANGRDIVYVKDVVTAILLAIDKDVTGLYNITSGKLLTVQEEVDMIIKVFSPDGTGEVRYCPEKPNSIEPFVYDNSRAKRVLDWFPQYSFEDMLRDLQREEAGGKFKFLLEKRSLMQSGMFV